MRETLSESFNGRGASLNSGKTVSYKDVGLGILAQVRENNGTVKAIDATASLTQGAAAVTTTVVGYNVSTGTVSVDVYCDRIHGGTPYVDKITVTLIYEYASGEKYFFKSGSKNPSIDLSTKSSNYYQNSDLLEAAEYFGYPNSSGSQTIYGGSKSNYKYNWNNINYDIYALPPRKLTITKNTGVSSITVNGNKYTSSTTVENISAGRTYSWSAVAAKQYDINGDTSGSISFIEGNKTLAPTTLNYFTIYINGAAGVFDEENVVYIGNSAAQAEWPDYPYLSYYYGADYNDYGISQWTQGTYDRTIVTRKITNVYGGVWASPAPAGLDDVSKWINLSNVKVYGHGGQYKECYTAKLWVTGIQANTTLHRYMLSYGYGTFDSWVYSPTLTLRRGGSKTFISAFPLTYAISSNSDVVITEIDPDRNGRFYSFKAENMNTISQTQSYSLSIMLASSSYDPTITVFTTEYIS